MWNAKALGKRCDARRQWQLGYQNDINGARNLHGPKQYSSMYGGLPPS
jgi:hypothetical protein